MLHVPGVVAPEPGDLVLRGSFDHGFELLDGETMRPVVSGVHSLPMVLTIAKERRPGALWQLNVDDRGRPVGIPLRIPVSTLR